MSILAIDIGKKNLGWCLYKDGQITYGLYNTESQISSKDIKQHGQTVCRLAVLTKWLKHFIHREKPTKLVVEKQVISNVVAKQLEASILTVAMLFRIECMTYDPKNKFKYLNQTYDSKKKEHKKIAIQYATKILNKFGNDLEEFNKYDKQDDISDAICMAYMTYTEDTDVNASDTICKVLRSQLN
jgi:Holliday junction resolvasome RuvABC endonuclease subunit